MQQIMHDYLADAPSNMMGGISNAEGRREGFYLGGQDKVDFSLIFQITSYLAKGLDFTQGTRK